MLFKTRFRGKELSFIQDKIPGKRTFVYSRQDSRGKDDAHSRQASGKPEESALKRRKWRIGGGKKIVIVSILPNRGLGVICISPTSCALNVACAGSDLLSTSRGFSRRGQQRWSSLKTKKQLPNRVEPTDVHIMPMTFIVPKAKSKVLGFQAFMELCQRPTHRSSQC